VSEKRQVGKAGRKRLRNRGRLREVVEQQEGEGESDQSIEERKVGEKYKWSKLVTSKTFLSQATVRKTSVKMRRRIRGGEWKDSGGEKNGITSGKNRG
jgi:hypothetical protein